MVLEVKNAFSVPDLPNIVTQLSLAYLSVFRKHTSTHIGQNHLTQNLVRNAVLSYITEVSEY